MNSKAKILIVYGTRPELIKMAPVIAAFRDRSDDFETVICSTAQHRDMVDELHGLFGIEPEIDLDLMRPAQKLNDLTARAVAAMERVFDDVRPDWMLAQGDTTTVMAASLAAFHRGVRIGHVEAGLRTGDLQAPFPEEANRSLTDLLADHMYAPTERARQVLLDEGRDPAKVFLTGNTVVDALQKISESLPEEAMRDEVLITVHRRESFGGQIQEIFSSIAELAGKFPQIEWVYPVHRNPNVRGPAEEILRGHGNISLLDPLPYDQLVRYMKRCRLILTDSGGIQEEAPTFSKPVLVLRDKTERPEGVEIGIAKLLGTDRATIVRETSRLLTDPNAYGHMSCNSNPYGDGRAAVRIAQIVAGEEPSPLTHAG